MWSKIEKTIKRRSSPIDSMTDIFDGELYRQLCCSGNILHANKNLTCTFNTDGVALYKSSRIEIWPVYIAINEIPPAERFQCKNIVLWGLWQGRGKPPTNVFMKPFVDEFKVLSDKGIYNFKGRNFRGKKLSLFRKTAKYLHFAGINFCG